MTEYRAHNGSEDIHDIPRRRDEKILLLSTIVRETPGAARFSFGTMRLDVSQRVHVVS